jgi:hypothetical protein
MNTGFRSKKLRFLSIVSFSRFSHYHRIVWRLENGNKQYSQIQVRILNSTKEVCLLRESQLDWANDRLTKWLQTGWLVEFLTSLPNSITLTYAFPIPFPCNPFLFTFL